MSIRRIGPATALSALATLALLAACGATRSHARTASAARPTDPISVKSSLTGHSTLPHRIAWTARPSVPPAQISEVDFLIDGRLKWVEHDAPYAYGNDGNFLVTSFLSAGRHRFTLKATTIDGKTASATVTARVPPAHAPPSALFGTWKRYVKQTDPSGPRSGHWHLGISKVGWETYDTSGGGNVIDVAYLKPGLVEVRTGMATGHDKVAGGASDEDLNGFCNNDPGMPVRYQWSVRGPKVQFRYVSGHACPGFTPFLSDAPMTR
jgi:hypothetical protein